MHADLDRRIAATGVTRLVYATSNSTNGLRHVLHHEAAVRQEALVFLAAVPVGFVVAPDAGWFVAMLAALLLLIAVELLNTAIEKLADHVSPGWHAGIGIVKDIGSAAVFVAILIAGLVWLAAAALRLQLI